MPVGEANAILGILKWCVGLTLALVIAIPALNVVVYVGGAILGIYLAGHEQEDRKAAEAAFRAKYEHIFNPVEDQSPLRAIDKFDEFTPSRGARVIVILPNELFGHTTWSELQVPVQLAAPHYTDEECKLLMEVLADKCRSVETVVNPVKNGVEIRMALQFVQRGDLGFIPSADNLRLELMGFEYGLGIRKIVEDDALDEAVPFAAVERAARERARIYADAARDCAVTKDRYGNCSIYRVKIDSRRVELKNMEIVVTTGNTSQSVVRAEPTR